MRLTNALVILLPTSPILYVFAVLMRRPLIAVALVPAILIAMGYLVVSILPTEERWNLLLLPLPLVLFLPTIALSILVPISLKWDLMWQVLPVAIIGILFSSIVSVPLRQFLLDLGHLPPIERW